MHGNARSSPLGRLGMVLRVKAGEPVTQVARGMGASRQCVSKWVRRYREEGRAGLQDRSSRPRCSPKRTSPELEERVLQARRTLRAVVESSVIRHPPKFNALPSQPSGGLSGGGGGYRRKDDLDAGSGHRRAAFVGENDVSASSQAAMSSVAK